MRENDLHELPTSEKKNKTNQEACLPSHLDCVTSFLAQGFAALIFHVVPLAWPFLVNGMTCMATTIGFKDHSTICP